MAVLEVLSQLWECRLSAGIDMKEPVMLKESVDKWKEWLNEWEDQLSFLTMIATV